MVGILHWLESDQNAPAWVQAGGAILALGVAVGAPLLQNWAARRADLRSLRYALRMQVRVMGRVYAAEFKKWQDPAFLVHPRPPQLPPLAVLDENFDKLGLLSEAEVYAIMWLWGSLHALSVFVSGKTQQQLQEAHEDVQVLLSDVCYCAALSLQPLPRSLKEDEDEGLRQELGRAYDSMKQVREKRGASLIPYPPPV